MQFKNNPSVETLEEINKTLSFIRQHTTGLLEHEGYTKWTQGQIVFSDKIEEQLTFVYMVGALKTGKVTLHIMPYYAVESLREKWSEALNPFISGKSCINFNKFSDLPETAISNILMEGTREFNTLMTEHYRKKQPKKSMK